MVKIILLDDQPIILDGLSSMLSSIKNITVTAAFLSATEALKSIQISEPDIIITDLKMPDMNGITFINKLRSLHIKSRILILSMCISPNIIQEAVQAGANGFILKQNATRDELLKAIGVLMDSKEYFADYDDIILTKAPIAKDTETTLTAIQVKDILTDDELKVLQVFAEGFTNKEISQKLMMKISLIEKRKASIMSKLQLKSNVDLIKFAINNGICYM